MTQSGQGEEPSPRVAREGIVLPSDGGEPLLPGQTGGPGGYQSAPHIPAPAAPPPSAPPGGQSWGTPWGPDQQTSAPQQGEGWGAAPQPQPQQWGARDPYQDPYQAQGQAHGEAQGQWGAQPSQPQPLPQQGAPAQAGGYDADQATSYYLPPVGPPVGQNAPQGGGSGVQGAPLPPVARDTDQPTSYYLPPVGSPVGQNTPQHAPQGGGPGAPLPPVAQDTDQPTSYYLPPVNQNAQNAVGAPLPPAVDPYGPAAGHGAVGGVPLPPADEGATQYIPPVAMAASEGATQYIPPVAPGALPPEMPAHGGGPLPPVSGPDAEATQYIAPVPGAHGERQPPSEFDSLFRSGPGGENPAQATQLLPRFESAQPPHAGHAGHAGHPGQSVHTGPSYADHGDDRRGGRSRSRVPLIAGVGVAIAAVGIGAGALLGGGGGDDSGDDSRTVSATAPASESASPSADPVEAQAVELDKLLADSGDSRASVISAVEDVKACNNLAQAAKDLRAAATQRNDLVTKLATLSVDRLPNHAELTTALNKAWKASASADNHYAAWAEQVAGKNGCKKGKARTTPQTAAGNTASGEASTQKIAAAKLWNQIARKYGLTERNRTQL
ncbi:hypothetical protein [Streptomyces sp. S.PB5]|uniref:hypothetical protein n=1 Tax=Streptomyces sp. S.PB5 TaxID=3020844 RepID=UPI0025B24973|nr:hypothetical protein [Streptomyces sp. S.PB5]MDN3023325.1 hypothetical protein [Streptomyces sp. S.PB5]